MVLCCVTQIPSESSQYNSKQTATPAKNQTNKCQAPVGIVRKTRLELALIMASLSGAGRLPAPSFIRLVSRANSRCNYNRTAPPLLLAIDADDNGALLAGRANLTPPCRAPLRVWDSQERGAMARRVFNFSRQEALK